MKLSPFIRSAIALLVVSSTTEAANVVLNATLDQTEVVNVGTNRYASRFYATTGDGFFQDFGTEGESTITYNLNAPVGQYFELSTDSGWTNLEFEIRYQNGGIGQGTGQFRDDSPLINYAAVGGGAVFSPASYNLSFISISGPGGDLNRGWLRGTPTAGTVYRFSQVSISATVPAGYNQNIATGFGSAYIEITATSTDFSSGAPASFVALQPIPEPSACLLGVLGGCLILHRRRS